MILEQVNFNPHSREGSDYLTLLLLLFMFDFNPHSREGSDIGLNIVREDYF